MKLNLDEIRSFSHFVDFAKVGALGQRLDQEGVGNVLGGVQEVPRGTSGSSHAADGQFKELFEWT